MALPQTKDEMFNTLTAISKQTNIDETEKTRRQQAIVDDFKTRMSVESTVEEEPPTTLEKIGRGAEETVQAVGRGAEVVQKVIGTVTEPIAEVLIEKPRKFIEATFEKGAGVIESLFTDEAKAKLREFGDEQLQTLEQEIVPEIKETIESIPEERRETIKALFNIGITGLDLFGLKALTQSFKQLVKGATKGARVSVSKTLKESATKDIEAVLAPTTRETKAITQRITPEILERAPKAATRKGLLEKVTQARVEAGDAIGDFGELTGTARTKPVLKALDREIKKSLVDGKVVDETTINNALKVRNVIAQFGETLEQESIRKIGRVLDKAVSKKKGFLLNLDESSITEMQKIASNSIRQQLASKNPKLAALNKEFTFWKNFEDVLQKSVERKTGQASPLTQRFGQLVGAAAGAGGGAGGVIIGAEAGKRLTGLFNSTGWKTVSAAAKTKLSKALVGGDTTAIIKELTTLEKLASVKVLTEDND